MRKCDEFRKITVLYCLIRVCVHSWGLNRENPNVTINRLVNVLTYLRDHSSIEKNEIKYLEDFLWNSEMPFKEGKEYGRLSLIFPFKGDSTNLNVEAKLHLFIKQGDLDSVKILDMLEGSEKRCKEKYLTELIRKITKHLRKQMDCEIIWETLEPAERDTINQVIEFVNMRNCAVFIMLFFQLHGSLRQPYQRETDRIISSKFFRHLQYKAQVMFNNVSDDQRTRMAHSLEVSGIAKVIAKQLECNWELAETMSLGHDLGHVPFGHSGEEALNNCLRDAWAGRFLHSLQSVKVVGLLAHHATVHEHFGINGLCISRPVIEGILKHDTDILFHDIRQAGWRLQYNDWRSAFNTRKTERDASESNEENDTSGVDESDYTSDDRKYGLAIGGLESQIVYWADKIAYAGHDWDELAKSGLLESRVREVEHIFKRMHQIRHIAHAHNGQNKEQIFEVNSEVDLIRLMRYHMDALRRKLMLREEMQSQSDPSLIGTSPRIFEAFEVSEKIVKEVGRVKNHNKVNKTLFKFIKENSNISPLATFIYQLSLCVKKIEKNKFKLKYFTKDDYKLVLDFFTITHDMIYLTKTYPRPYKKTDDVLWVLGRYLVEIDHRCIVQALQSNLLEASRIKLSRDSLDENDIRRKGRISFTKEHDDLVFDNADNQSGTRKLSLSDLRDRVRKQECIKRNGNTVELKDLKRMFREAMQKEMFIGIDESSTIALNRVTDFIFKYYIESNKVRVMKIKAHKVITKLFTFYMKNEDMLPPASKQAIDSYSQKLTGFLGDRITSDSDTRLLVVQYIRELHSLGKLSFDNNYPVEARFLEEHSSVISAKNDKNIEGKTLRDILMRADSEKYYELCRHIAKARIVADYIASMTDRFAENKYNEIISSSTMWS